MGTRTQHTKTDLSRCVARLLLAAQHARLAVGSRRGGPPLVRVRFGGNSPPLPTNWSVLFSSSEFFCSRVSVFESFFLLLWCQATVCAWHCGPARVLPAARAAAATPRRVTSKVQSGVSRVRRKPKSRGYWPKIDFFFVDFERIRFSAGLSRDASLGGARFFVFFFFFVLLSEDNHRRSPHVAVGVTRRLTLRKCLACMPIC